MEIVNLKPCREIGLIKDAIKEAILDGEISNEHAYAFMLKRAEKSQYLTINEILHYHSE